MPTNVAAEIVDVLRATGVWAVGNALRPLDQIPAPHAHTVSVDPRTHLVYLPLENLNGRPVLRIYEPMR